MPSASPTRMEALERRVLLSAAIEPIDGVGNNVANPTWGTAGSDLLRLAQAAYTDGLSTPNLSTDLSARAISNILNSQADPNNPGQDLNTVDQNNLSDFGYAFGQFIDHDMDLTLDGGAEFDIPVAAGDPIGPNALPFTRSQTDPATGITDPAQQTTDVTSYLDLSQDYGSDAATAAALRTMSGGLLKTSPGNMLPYLNSTYFTPDQLATFNQAAGGQQNLNGLPMDQMYATGDVRGNENVELLVLETLFVRNHNNIATQVQQQNPTWTDEQIYQEARKLNIAQYQSIIYNEWIPAVLGPHALGAYTGYKPNVNATIANEFSTVAFRFGHSLVSEDITRQNNQGLESSDDISLATDFFDPAILNPAGVIDPLTGQTSTDIDPILKGEADANGQAMDLMAVGDLRNLLFGDFGAGGQDLMARDVQRDRDNGIPDYNTLRVDLGLKPVTSFAQISSNPQVQEELAQAYPGGVGTIDAFEGGLAENHVKGSDVGQLFQTIMVNQFRRLRSGDRFFYQNESFTAAERKILQQGNTLTKVIEDNTSITNLQPDAMIFTASIGGKIVGLPGRGRPPGPRAYAGVTVQLTDGSGNVLATTTADPHGNYVFTQQSGIYGTGIYGTGIYNINVIPPEGWDVGTPAPANILISHGGMKVTLQFGLYAEGATPAPPPRGPLLLPPPPPPPPPPPGYGPPPGGEPGLQGPPPTLMGPGYTHSTGGTDGSVLYSGTDQT